MVKVIPLTAEKMAATRDFLQQHEDTSQFLLTNLADFGPILAEHHNSGNYKLLVEKDEIRGVFVLAKRGNLLAQTTENFAEAILSACSQEPIALKGFIGHEESVMPIVDLHRKRNPTFKPSYESREILYRFEWKGAQVSKHHKDVRLLTPDDYAQYAPLSDAYLKEFGLPEQTSEEAREKDFARHCARKVHWGLFQDGNLVSKAALNSLGPTIGQVGGVYTKPELRRRGLSRNVMLHLLEDCRRLHNHKKNILFTGTADVPAQKLYEAIGYERCGYFTIVFGE